MKIKLIGVILLVLSAIVAVVVFSACGKEDPESEIPADEAFVISVDGGEVTGDKIRMEVEEGVNELPLASVVKVSDGATWKLYSDSDGEQEIGNKVAAGDSGELDNGANIFYITVSSAVGDISNTYELTIYRHYSVEVNYSVGDEVVRREVLTDGETPIAAPYGEEGYTFSGWLNPDGSKYSPSPVYEDITLFADIAANEYTVTLDADGGDIVIGEEKVTYDSPFTLPVPTRTDYKFLGWYYGAIAMTDGNGESLNAWTNTEDLTLVAKWERNAFTVYLNADGGTVTTDSVKVTAGVSYALPVPVRENHTFLGWYDGDERLTDERGNSLSVWQGGDNVTVTAKWRRNSCVITLDSDGGTASSLSVNVNYGSHYTLPIPEKTGHTFLGWYMGDVKYTDENGRSLSAWQSEEDADLTAKWQVNTYSVTLTAIGWSGEFTGGGNHAYGERVTVYAAVPLSYDFEGWYNGSELISSERSYTFIMPDGELNLTARASMRTDLSLYEYSATDSTLIITGVAYEFRWQLFGHIAIPYGVTKIGNDAFVGETQIRSVDFPDTLTTIGTRAFGYCTALYTVKLPSSLEIIDGDAFLSCTNLIEVQNYSSLDISAGSSNNGKVAYYAENVCTSENGSHLYKINDFVIYDGDGNCTLMFYSGEESEIELPQYDKNYTIGQYAFYECDWLTKIVIPEGVIGIEDDSFGNCDLLTDITIPVSIKTLSKAYFDGSHHITVVRYNGDLSGWLALGIKENIFTDYDLYFGGAMVTDLVIPDGISDTGRSFTYCRSLTSVTIPASMTKIPDYAFKSCYGLKSVTILEGVTEIGVVAFENCEELFTLDLPDTLTTVRSSAFYACRMLMSVRIPSNVTVIEEDAFGECLRLKEVYNLSALNVAIGSYENGSIALNASVVHTSDDAESIIRSVGDFIYAYTEAEVIVLRYTGSSSSVVLPSDIEGKTYVIGSGAFVSMNFLTELTIPDSVYKMENAAFSSSENIEKVYYKGTIEGWKAIEFESGASTPLYYGARLYIDGVDVTDML